MLKQKHANHVFQAFLALSDKDKKTVLQFAKKQCAGTTFSEADDLVHEAIMRIADGNRKWPPHVGFPPFLSNTIRSVADADRRRLETRFSVSLEDADSSIEIKIQCSSAQDICSQHQELERMNHTVAHVRYGLRHDPSATQVLNGLIAGTKRSTLRAETGLCSREFANARERVMRRLLATHFPERVEVQKCARQGRASSRSSCATRKTKV